MLLDFIPNAFGPPEKAVGWPFLPILSRFKCNTADTIFLCFDATRSDEWTPNIKASDGITRA